MDRKDLKVINNEGPIPDNNDGTNQVNLELVSCLKTDNKDNLINLENELVNYYYGNDGISIQSIVSKYAKLGIDIKFYSESKLVINGMFYYNGKLIKGNPDIESFCQISKTGLFADKTNIYWGGILLEGADVKSFNELFFYLTSFLIDQTAIFGINGKLFDIEFIKLPYISKKEHKILNRTTFVKDGYIYIGNFLIKDQYIFIGNNVYYYNKNSGIVILIENLEEAIALKDRAKYSDDISILNEEDIIYKNIEQTEQTENSGLYTNNINNINDILNQFITVSTVNLKLFEEKLKKIGINYKLYYRNTGGAALNYIMLNGIIYFRGPRSSKFRIIKLADSKTFRLINYNYSVDKNNVYYNGKQVKGLASSDFSDKFLLYGNYLVFEKGVIYKNKLIKGITPNIVKRYNPKKSFYIQESNSKSVTIRTVGNKTYYCQFVIEGEYLYTKEELYYGGKFVRKIDIDTARIIDKSYFIDSFGKVYCGDIVKHI